MEGDQKKEDVTTGSSSYSVKYAIIGYVGSIPIRKNNQLTMYITEHNYRRIAQIVLDTGFSAAKVLAISATPCEHCRGKSVVIDLDGKPYEIPRNLFPSKRQNSGITIANSKKRDE